jgi:hypothetical protein
MAMEDSVGGDQESLEWAMDFNCLNGILRTGRNMAAGGVGKRREDSPVKIDRKKYDLYQYPLESIRYFFEHNHLLKLVIPQTQDEVT